MPEMNVRGVRTLYQKVSAGLMRVPPSLRSQDGRRLHQRTHVQRH